MSFFEFFFLTTVLLGIAWCGYAVLKHVMHEQKMWELRKRKKGNSNERD